MLIYWVALAACMIALGLTAGAAVWSLNGRLDIGSCARCGVAAGLTLFLLLALGGLLGHVDAAAVMPWAGLPVAGAVVALPLGFSAPLRSNAPSTVLAVLATRASLGASFAVAIEVVWLLPLLQLHLLYAAGGAIVALPLAAMAERHRNGPWPSLWLRPSLVPWVGAALGAMAAFELALAGPEIADAALRLWPLALGGTATLVPLLRGRFLATARATGQVRRPPELAAIWRGLTQTAPPRAPQYMFAALTLGVGGGALLVPGTLALGVGLVMVGGLEAARLRPMRRADEGAFLPVRKPLLRGVIHVATFVLAVVVLGQLLTFPGPAELRVVAIVYGLGAVVVHGASALYHRYPWSERAGGIMQKVDYSGIFVFIAAAAVAVAPSTTLGRGVLWAVVVGAALGIAVRWWRRAPIWLIYTIYVSVGWLPTIAVLDLYREVGRIATTLVLLGGVAYTAGAAAYFVGKRYPSVKIVNPWPRVFGYHEIFHAATFVGALLQWWAIWNWILPVRAAAVTEAALVPGAY